MKTKYVVVSGVKHPIENFNLRHVVFEKEGKVFGIITYDVSKKKDQKEYQNLFILAGVEFDEVELKNKLMRAIIYNGKIRAIGHRTFDMFFRAGDGEEIETEEKCMAKL